MVTTENTDYNNKLRERVKEITVAHLGSVLRDSPRRDDPRVFDVAKIADGHRAELLTIVNGLATKLDDITAALAAAKKPKLLTRMRIATLSNLLRVIESALTDKVQFRWSHAEY